MTSIIRTLLAILAVLLLAPLGFCVALPMAVNEVKAVYWGFNYGTLVHPPETTRVLLRQGIDKTSNGDDCDFFVIEARSYVPGAEASIKDHYAQQSNPIDSRLPLKPEFSPETASLPRLHPYDAFSREVSQLHDGPYYLLEAWVSVESGPPMIDWRCP